jgi:hypothetical protein
LGKALCVSIDTGVFAHDVLDGFDEVGDVGHGLLNTKSCFDMDGGGF